MSLTSPSETIDVLRRHNIRLAKKLGQNFLVDENILDKIMNAAGLSRQDVVLEIGPGIGTLTERLAACAKKVIVVEFDHRFVDILANDTLKDTDNLTIIQADAMKIPYTPASFEPAPNIVVANLPYNIATPILMKMLDELTSVHRFIIMVQKEIAERLMAKPSSKSYGAVSVKVGLQAEVKQVAAVSKNSFLPQPRVDSMVVEVIRRPKSRENIDFHELLIECVEAAFEQRRKTIKNSLVAHFKTRLSENDVVEVLNMAKIDPKKRGETLSLEQFEVLAVAMNAVMTRKT